MLTVAKLDRYDLINNPLGNKPSFTVWFSGCSIRCPDCHNNVLWDKDAGTKFTPTELATYIIRECKHLDINTVILLGGEPLEQDICDMTSLCTMLNEYNIHVWLYTGHCVEYWLCNKDLEGLLDCISIVKSGMYLKELAQDGFPASSNQSVHEKDRYNKWENITNRFREVSHERRNEPMPGV